METGRKLLKVLGSTSVFFSIDVIAATLKEAGTVPEVSEEWIMADIRGRREGRQALTRTVGRGSR